MNTFRSGSGSAIGLAPIYSATSAALAPRSESSRPPMTGIFIGTIGKNISTLISATSESTGTVGGLAKYREPKCPSSSPVVRRKITDRLSISRSVLIVAAISMRTACTYPTNVWEVGRSIGKRAEAAGCPAIVFTVDQQEGANRETLFRAQRADKRDCTACHKTAYTGYARGRPGGASGGFSGYVARKPMFDGLDVSKVTALRPIPMDWDFVKCLRDAVTVKLLLRGIVTREDAQLA